MNRNRNLRGSCVASIAAALAACMPCPAAPPSRDLVLADRVSESRSAPGMMVNVNLGSVDARDSLGRIAHVRGIYVKAVGAFTLGAANDAVLAYQLRGLFSSLRLEDVTGHPYWPDIDARVILDDNWFRHWSDPTWPFLHTGTQDGAAPAFAYGPTITADFGIPANLGAGAITRDCSWYAPLTTLGPGGNPLAGLIPLVALQKNSNSGSLRFRLLTVIPGSPAGVTLDNFLDGEGNVGLDVWLDVVYLPSLIVGPAYQLDSYTLPDFNGILHNPQDATELAVMRFFPEDSPNGGAFAGRDAAANVGTWNLDVAGQNAMPGMSIEDAMMRMAQYENWERDSANIRSNARQSLPLIDYGATPNDPTTWAPQAMVLIPYRQRGFGEAAGEITFKWANASGAFFRYMQRTVGCNEADRAAAFARAASCDPCARAVMVDARGNPTDAGTTKGTLVIADPKVGRQ